MRFSRLNMKILKHLNGIFEPEVLMRLGVKAEQMKATVYDAIFLECRIDNVDEKYMYVSGIDYNRVPIELYKINRAITSLSVEILKKKLRKFMKKRTFKLYSNYLYNYGDIEVVRILNNRFRKGFTFRYIIDPRKVEGTPKWYDKTWKIDLSNINGKVSSHEIDLIRMFVDEDLDENTTMIAIEAIRAAKTMREAEILVGSVINYKIGLQEAIEAMEKVGNRINSSESLLHYLLVGENILHLNLIRVAREAGFETARKFIKYVDVDDLRGPMLSEIEIMNEMIEIYKDQLEKYNKKIDYFDFKTYGAYREICVAMDTTGLDPKIVDVFETFNDFRQFLDRVNLVPAEYRYYITSQVANYGEKIIDFIFKMIYFADFKDANIIERMIDFSYKAYEINNDPRKYVEFVRKYINSFNEIKSHLDIAYLMDLRFGFIAKKGLRYATKTTIERFNSAREISKLFNILYKVEDSMKNLFIRLVDEGLNPSIAFQLVSIEVGMGFKCQENYHCNKEDAMVIILKKFAKEGILSDGAVMKNKKKAQRLIFESLIEATTERRTDMPINPTPTKYDDIIVKKGKFVGYILDPNDPLNLVIGNIIPSCQQLGGDGESSAIYTVNSDRSFTFVIKRKGAFYPSAESMVWIDGDTLVFDNIEAHGSQDLTSIVLPIYEEFAEIMRDKFGIKNVYIGTGYTDVGLPYEIATREEIGLYHLENEKIYTDTKNTLAILMKNGKISEKSKQINTEENPTV